MLFEARVAWVMLSGSALPLLAQSAPSTQLACPESIPATSIQLQPVPSGWTPYVDGPLYLSGAAPIDGRPQRRGQLVPGSERKQQRWSVARYRLEGSYPDGKWLQCSYGAYGEISLSKRLDDGVRFCEISYRKGGKAGQGEVRVDCR
ncbi:STY0301 family protein [Janthinobacterium aquaticum]|uniref:STY0301 family protein n=1 Tax=Janthinobacterium sp. FT58W TaxID=2654254 RepID=UPI0012649437|nr:STY0301 family protein [Janthinobacterium sp. FT58W]KAB8042293.1 hypothetical protein GCM43_14610 [Janthinobacterium sp. FT58W]